MFVAVVPALNEEERVGRLLGRLLTLSSIKNIFVILNGSNLLTQEEVYTLYERNRGRITVVSFTQALGIDVPRSVGAKLAYMSGAPYTLFADGDLVGDITKELFRFMQETKANHVDLALMNCYPHRPRPHTLNEPMFFFRRRLNEKLNIENKIGVASPSHGPHIVSRRLLSLVPWADFSVPPTVLTHAVRHHLRIHIAGTIPHACLGSQIKNGTHSQLIVDTIVGDSLEATCMADQIERTRCFNGKYYLGYHPKRRFDILTQFLGGRLMV